MAKAGCKLATIATVVLRGTRTCHNPTGYHRDREEEEEEAEAEEESQEELPSMQRGERTGMVSSFDDGLVFDTRCWCPPGQVVKTDHQPLPRSSDAEGKWTAIVVMKKEPIQEVEHMGVAVKCDLFLLELFTNIVRIYTNRVKIDCTDFQDAIDGRIGGAGLDDGWRVIALSVDCSSGQVTLHLDGNELNQDILGGHEYPVTRFVNPVVLGDVDFNGSIARFSLYNRVLSTEEIGLLSEVYLNPRVAEIRGKDGKFVNGIYFLFSDSSEEYYGGKGGSDNERYLTLDQDEFVVSVRVRSHDHFLAEAISVDTSSGRSFCLTGWHGNPTESEEWWDFQYSRTSESHEIYGLEVSNVSSRGYGMFRIQGIKERKICSSPGRLRCMAQIEKGYLDGLNVYKEEATEGARKLSKPLPTVSDWMRDSKEVWYNYLNTVRYELLKPKKFLDLYVIDDVDPMHTSSTAAVLSASWKDRRVALKFMVNAGNVLTELNGRVGVGADFVVPITAVFADARHATSLEEDYKNSMTPLQFDGETVEVQSIEGLAGKLKNEYDSRSERTRTIEDGRNYQFCVVMLLGDRTLHYSLGNDHFAGIDWPLIRKIATDIARSLDEIHAHKRIHADLKPRNILRVGVNWQLIDMDVSCSLDRPFEGKTPSSGYCPPEMAEALLKSMDSDGSVDARKLSEHYTSAGVEYDLWSFGCVLYEMVYDGEPLFTTDHRDNVKDAKTVAGWTIADRNRRLRLGRNPVDDAKDAKDLLEKLLEPNPDVRRQHFKPGIEIIDVLEHPFFLKVGLPPEIRSPVFISHTGQDDTARNFAAHLGDKMKDQDIEYFYDARCIPPSVQWEQVIREAVSDCSVFVAVLSPTYFKRYWCMHELDLALTNKRAILPIYYSIDKFSYPRNKDEFCTSFVNDRRVKDGEVAQWWTNVSQLLPEIQGIRRTDNARKDADATLKNEVIDFIGKAVSRQRPPPKFRSISSTS